MKKSRRLVQLFNEDQLHFLADTSTDEHVEFRTEIDSGQVDGKIYLIVSGKVSFLIESDICCVQGIKPCSS